MKEHVNYSSDVWGWTIFWVCIFCIVFFLPFPGWFWWMWWCFFIFMMLLALCWTPLSVSADDRTVRIRRPLRSREIPLDEIASVEMVGSKTGRPTATSQGFFGYWGKGKDEKNGSYTSYVGKGDERFLITLKDGRKVMVSANNAPALVDYIQARLK